MFGSSVARHPYSKVLASLGLIKAMNRIETVCLKPEYDYLAPDVSEIRLLVAGNTGSLCHCTLPERGISSAVYHKTVEEIWYCISGQGEVCSAWPPWCPARAYI